MARIASPRTRFWRPLVDISNGELDVAIRGSGGARALRAEDRRPPRRNIVAPVTTWRRHSRDRSKLGAASTEIAGCTSSSSRAATLGRPLRVPSLKDRPRRRQLRSGWRCAGTAPRLSRGRARARAQHRLRQISTDCRSIRRRSAPGDCAAMDGGRSATLIDELGRPSRRWARLARVAAAAVTHSSDRDRLDAVEELPSRRPRDAARRARR